MSFELVYKPMRWKRISQFFKKTHKGIDLAAPTGTPIYAAAPGTVVAASYGAWHSSYGKHVVIYHGNGIYTNYAHMSKIKTRIGRKVKAGDLIGLCGSTGRSTGPHLHFEIRIGRANRVNPKPYLDDAPYVGAPQEETDEKANYRLLEPMNIRIGPGVQYPRIGASKWTRDAQKHKTKSGLLAKGTIVTCKDRIKNDNGEYWIKTPSGWICEKGKKRYLEKVKK